MSQEIYKWVKNLAVFYILFTSLLHLVPNEKYERYVRFFMGILLIFMLSTPLFAIIGKSGELIDDFQMNYQVEASIREQQEKNNLQEFYLEKGYELQVEEKIIEEMENLEIKLEKVDVNIEDGDMMVTLYVQEEPNQQEERRIADGLRTKCQIREGQYKIEVAEYGMETMGNIASFGTSSSGFGDADS